MLLRAFGLLTLGLMCAGTARADGLAEELKGRRERLMRSLAPDTMAIFWSAPEREYSRE